MLGSTTAAQARRGALCALIPAAALLAATPASAGGFETEYPDNGARALGRGGAFVARADDPTAIYYNPAGLGKQRGVNLMVSGNLIMLQQGLQPDPDLVLARSHPRSFGPVEHDGSIFVAPMVVGHFDFEALPDWDFAVGIYGPAANGKRRYPRTYPITRVEAAGRDDVTDRVSKDAINGLLPNGMIAETDLLLAFPTVSVAYTIMPELRVGVSLQAAMFQARLMQGFAGAVPAMAELEVHDYFTPTGILGIHYTPSDRFEFGLSVRPPFRVEAEGTARIRAFGYDESRGEFTLQDDVRLVNGGQEDDSLSFVFNHPLMLRAGARYVHRRADGSELFDVEIDYLYQMQSVHDAYQVRFGAAGALPPGSTESVPVPAIDDRRNYVDTHGVRIGGDYSVLPDLLTVRAGATYETGSSPDNYTHLDFPGLDQYSASLGVGVAFGFMTLDLGYAYVGMSDRRVSNSEVPLLEIPEPSDPKTQKVVGNGTFSATYHIVGLQSVFHF